MRAPVRVVSPGGVPARGCSAQKPNGPPPVGVPPKNAVQPGIPGDSTPAANPPDPTDI